MKPGRFRKGKKAFKANRHGKLYNRYMAFLFAIEFNRRVAQKIIQMAVVNAMGLQQVRAVQQSFGATPQEKAIKIAVIVIDTHAAVAKVYENQENIVI